MAGMALFEATGWLCGVDHVCVNATGALLIAGCVCIGIIHARQITRSVGASLWVTALWLLSPTVLALTMWQSTRFDSLAFFLALVTMSLWWWVLGETRLSKLAMAAFVVGSVFLLALAFNAKEITYFLPLLLVILALVRGTDIGVRRRNLALAAIPLLYSGFFIAYALTHVASDYGANSSLANIPGNLEQLVLELLGLHRGFMGIYQGGGEIAQSQSPSWRWDCWWSRAWLSLRPCWRSDGSDRRSTAPRRWSGAQSSISWRSSHPP